MNTERYKHLYDFNLFTHCVIVSVLFMSLAYCNCDSTTNVKLWSLEYFKALQQRVFAAPLSITAYVNVLCPLASTLTGTTPMYAPHVVFEAGWQCVTAADDVTDPDDTGVQSCNS